MVYRAIWYTWYTWYSWCRKMMQFFCLRRGWWVEGAVTREAPANFWRESARPFSPASGRKSIEKYWKPSMKEYWKYWKYLKHWKYCKYLMVLNVVEIEKVFKFWRASARPFNPESGCTEIENFIDIEKCWSVLYLLKLLKPQSGAHKGGAQRFPSHSIHLTHSNRPFTFWVFRPL